MISNVQNFFKIKEIRHKILFTLAMLVIFKIGTYIPVPGVDPSVFDAQAEGGVLDVMNTFGGGALKNFSIFAMGIMPYITASIVTQLLQMDVVPKFAEWSRQGEVGRRKIAQFTRYFTIILAFIQSIGMSFAFNQMLGGTLIEDNSIGSYLIIAIVLTTGTAFLLWLGEQITEHGVGNGISIIIFAGILGALPSSLIQFYEQQFVGAQDNTMAVLTVVGMVVGLLLLVAFAVYVLQAIRKIPIQYARGKGRQAMLAPQATFLPLKVNPAGVIPVIFAMAFLMLPQSISLFFQDQAWAIKFAEAANPASNIGMVLYIILIILFAYFYAFVQVNPEKMADNLKNQGSYIPGIRPGKSTEEYITNVLYRLVFVGSIFLAFIAVLPILLTRLMDLPQTIQIGGTSLLIVIGVALETMKQLEAQAGQREYRGFRRNK
ncbi:preprotein translocase subunit SecY [Nosocomiicoccus ampullae]|uniref:preprotein translocase subunit SecY n=1 Tax=Nosocomiicoccus ampullae TaxID=489910 RepID=UPI001C601BB1|nr:preprotein translocase subunit SecY [Nosocomiicoccus ampullae]QYA48602.1 preprotein translocase subunit SecY [Nosocomiicoccus ampullae]